MNENKKNEKNQPLKKITIKQFEWFEVETKVREILTQLLQPFNKKQTQQSLKINQIKRTLSSLVKKTDDHEFLLNQENSSKPTYIQMQDDKIADIERKLNETEHTQNHKIEEMKKIVGIYEGKILQINQIETKIEEEVNLRIKQEKVHKEFVNQQISLMLKKIDNQTTDINSFKGTTKNTITRLQTKITGVENRIINLEDEMKRKTNEMRKNLQSIQKNSERIAGIFEKVGDIDVRLLDREKDAKLSEKFLGKVVEINSQLSFLKSYIQSYIPLYTQMQISETLDSFLKGPKRTKLCIFEENLFAKMHQNILTEGGDTLQTKMSDYSNRIRKIVNRNKKYVIRMKVEQTIRFGNNVYEIREIDENFLKQDEQTVVKTAPVVIPEEQISAIIEEKWSGLVDRVENKIKERIDPLDTWVQEMQEQSLLRMIENDKKFSEIRKKAEDVEATTTLQKKEQEEFESLTKKNFDQDRQKSTKMKDQIKDLVNFCSVFNHIIIQDQIDRQGLALYALRGGTQPQQTMPNIQLDEKCVSCSSGNASGIVTQAFKMACLAYNPSEIKIQQRTFSREQVLEISTNILDKLKKKIQTGEMEVVENKKKPEKKHSRSSTHRNTFHKQHRTLDASRNRDFNTLLPALSTARRKASIKNEREKMSSGSIFY